LSFRLSTYHVALNTLGTGYLNCLYAYKRKSASPVLNVLIIPSALKVCITSSHYPWYCNTCLYKSVNQLSIEMDNGWAWWFVPCEMHVCWNILEDLGAQSLNLLLYVWKNGTDRKVSFWLESVWNRWTVCCILNFYA
jgi:hypothetical protein